MYHIFTSTVELPVEKADYTEVLVYHGRRYYISTRMLDDMLRRRGADGVAKQVFFQELSASPDRYIATFELWLGMGETDIFHLQQEHLEVFTALYEGRSSPKLFVNLGKRHDPDTPSIGEEIFIDALPTLVQKGEF
jgi:hypothetical protein